MTRRTVWIAAVDGDVARRRSGGSPINVFVTAKADFEMDLKLYPPFIIVSDESKERGKEN